MSTVTEVTLRPYQARAVHLAHEALRAGQKRILVCLPTGAGKRIIAVWWILKVLAQGKECLFVTDRMRLIEQASDELNRVGVEHGIIMGGQEENRVPRVQLGLIQSLSSRYLSTGKLDELPTADIIIVDEAHKDLSRYVALLGHYPAAYAFLLTATPVGPNGRTLVQEGYADVLTEGVLNTQLIRQGYLLPTRVIAPSEPNIEGVKIQNRREYNEGELSRAVQSVTCFADVFAEWAPFADRKTIVFAPGIDYCTGLAEAPFDSFKARGIRAAVMHSKVNPKERKQIWHDFAEGDLRVLVTVDMVREGVDVPAASCAIDLQPNSQLRTYWQKIGRVKRPFPGQEHAVYIDMAGNYWRFPHPDEDPEWPTGEQTTQDLIDEANFKRKTAAQIRCPKCAAVRKSGARCPECGFEAEPQQCIRKIRMGNGKLKEVPIEFKRKVEKTADQRRQDAWKSCLFIGLKTGKTLKQCSFIYKQRQGDWPCEPMPCLPKFGSADWNLKVGQLFDARTIMQEFSG